MRILIRRSASVPEGWVPSRGGDLSPVNGVRPPGRTRGSGTRWVRRDALLFGGSTLEVHRLGQASKSLAGGAAIRACGHDAGLRRFPYSQNRARRACSRLRAGAGFRWKRFFSESGARATRASLVASAKSAPFGFGLEFGVRANMSEPHAKPAISVFGDPPELLFAPLEFSRGVRPPSPGHSLGRCFCRSPPPSPWQPAL